MSKTLYRDPNLSLSWPIPYPAVQLIARSEGLELTSYLCPAGVWTIGYGRTEGVTKGMSQTWEQASQDLLLDLTQRGTAVQKLCTEAPTPSQLGALLSLAYNIGTANFSKSSVLRFHNQANHKEAASSFLAWDKARDPKTGKLRPLPGLTTRRAAEAKLYAS